MNESTYRDLCAAMRTFDLVVLRLRESTSATTDEKALFDELIKTVAVLSTLLQFGAPDPLTAAIDRLTTWRTVHLNEPIAADEWTQVFAAAQEVRSDVSRWAAAYPGAYQEA